jgi:hypothetical protein
MPFEVFSKRAAGKLKQPTITVQKRGTLSLNASAASFLADGEIPNEIQVELLYDREAKIIGIRRAKELHPNVYTLRKQQKSDSYLLAGRAFTQYYQIPVGEARRYNATDFGDGILGANLNDEYSTVTRDRDEEENGEEAK